MSSPPPLRTILDLPDFLYENYLVSFRIRSDNYFNQNSLGSAAGHFAIVCRADLAMQTTAVLGCGVIFGNTQSLISPTARIESWCNGHDPVQYLLDGATPCPLLSDGVDYDFTFSSYVPEDRNNQTLRFTIASGGAPLYDTGPVHDPNLFYNPAKNSIYCGHVFDNPNPVGGWKFAITDVVLTRF